MPSPSDPVETTCTSGTACESILMMEPLPNCFSIWASAAARALDLLSSMSLSLFVGDYGINGSRSKRVDLYIYTVLWRMQAPPLIPRQINGLEQGKTAAARRSALPHGCAPGVRPRPAAPECAAGQTPSSGRISGNGR